jgi:phosphoglycolate phosphatase
MPRNANALIFDLDGTLLDTLDDLADAVNSVLAANSFPTHPTDAYRFFVGEGMETLMRRAAPQDADEATIRVLFDAMRTEYGRNWAGRTKPYPGIVSLLEHLVALRLPLGILSNKPHDFTRLTVRHFFPGIPFASVQGSPPGGRAKPDPALALELAQGFGVAPEEVFFMGDSKIDMDTATAAGMVPVGALWGFRPESELREHGAKILLHKPEDLLARL